VGAKKFQDRRKKTSASGQAQKKGTRRSVGENALKRRVTILRTVDDSVAKKLAVWVPE